jgi:hypothetical protein
VSDCERMLLLWDRYISSRYSDLGAFVEAVNPDENFILTVYVTRDGVASTTVDSESARRARAKS